MLRHDAGRGGRHGPGLAAHARRHTKHGSGRGCLELACAEYGHRPVSLGLSGQLFGAKQPERRQRSQGDCVAGPVCRGAFVARGRSPRGRTHVAGIRIEQDRRGGGVSKRRGIPPGHRRAQRKHRAPVHSSDHRLGRRAGTGRGRPAAIGWPAGRIAAHADAGENERQGYL